MNLNRCCLLVAALLAEPACLPAQSTRVASGPTNAAPIHRVALPHRTSIIYIACQGLALSDLSCYGQTNFQTPNLDRLAKEGARFTDYRALGEELAPAQAALMTGNLTAFTPDTATLASRLQQAGYHTGLIGEWRLGPKPWTQGFDEFVGFLNEAEANNYYSDFLWRYAPKSVFDITNRTLSDWSGREEIYANLGGHKVTFLPDVLLQAMANFARINAPDFANRYRPFFLLVNLPAPHSVTPGQDDYPVPTDAPFTGEAWPQAAKNRAALLTRLDDKVGHLLEQLTKAKMTNDVAIFLAGAVAPKKFADPKLNFWKVKDDVRGGPSADRLRVPMLVYWPYHVPAGLVSHRQWSAVDFAPTALAMAGAKPVAGFTGVSVLPELLGESGTNAPGGLDRRAGQ